MYSLAEQGESCEKRRLFLTATCRLSIINSFDTYNLVNKCYDEFSLQMEKTNSFGTIKI